MSSINFIAYIIYSGDEAMYSVHENQNIRMYRYIEVKELCTLIDCDVQVYRLYTLKANFTVLNLFESLEFEITPWTLDYLRSIIMQCNDK